MSENKQSFLEILNNYFSNLNESNIVIGNKQKITIPMEWIFTKKMDREIIQRAFINLICRANNQYKDKLKKNRYFYQNIASLEIETSDRGTNLIINARDGWTKIVITEDSELRGLFYAINEDTLYREIQKVCDFKNINEISKLLNVSQEERGQLIELMRDPERFEKRREKVELAMVDAAQNLTEYYKYMSGEKRKQDYLRGIIIQRKDKQNKGTRNGSGAEMRKSDIYDFKERAKILEEMNPQKIIAIDQIEDGNTISKFAYVTYVYKNPRENKGYLFIAEPVEGKHTTRVRFVSQEEYDDLKLQQDKNKLVYLAEEFLEMSDKEFENSKFSKRFYHTSIEKMREKYRRITIGEKMSNPTKEYRYEEIDKIIFNGEKRVTKGKIKEMIEGVTHQEVSQAREVLFTNIKDKDQSFE